MKINYTSQLLRVTNEMLFLFPKRKIIAKLDFNPNAYINMLFDMRDKDLVKVLKQQAFLSETTVAQ